MQRQAIRQGFCCEGPLTGMLGLLANPPATAEPSTPLEDSGACATTSDDSYLRYARPPRRTYAWLCSTEHEIADDPDARPSLGPAPENPDRGLDFDLTSLTSLNPSVSGGERWVAWPTQRGVGGTSVNPDTGVGEYAGDGTIDLSVLGGGVGGKP